MTPLTRLPDWEARLTEYLATSGPRPHAYGRHDCMVFAAGSVVAVSGFDFARGHRRKYTSAAGATRYLRSLGFSAPAEMLDTLLPSRDLAFTQRGDIVSDSEGAPGVCLGATAAFLSADPARPGLFTRPRAEWLQAWAVG